MPAYGIRCNFKTKMEKWHFRVGVSELAWIRFAKCEPVRNIHVGVKEISEHKHTQVHTQWAWTHRRTLTTVNQTLMHFQSLAQCLGEASQGSAVTSPNTQGSRCHGSLCFSSFFILSSLFSPGRQKDTNKNRDVHSWCHCVRTIIPPSNWQINPARKPTKATSTRAQH